MNSGEITINKFLIFTFCISVTKVETIDTILNTTVDAAWESIIFTIPVKPPFNRFGSFCHSRSIFYCLTLFKLKSNEVNAPAVQYFPSNFQSASREPFAALTKMKQNGLEQLNIIFGPSYKKHNFFVISDGCCGGQFVWYFNYGFKQALLTPSEYFERLTDYSEGEKQLNYVVSYYHTDCGVNIITKIGFGRGKLSRYGFLYKYCS